MHQGVLNALPLKLFWDFTHTNQQDTTTIFQLLKRLVQHQATKTNKDHEA